MNFTEFKANVVQWATDRGIYEHSTITAQLLKALSELGELADAIIKGDRDALKDAIGDVAVCLVNASHMNVSVGSIRRDEPAIAYGYSRVDQIIASLCGFFAQALDDRDVSYDSAIGLLRTLAEWHDMQFMECCEAAWLEIKDRKGRMVPGGAFVKEE
ncbi:MAG: hypothetical protein GXZ05_09570 [Gammaproteobacteria bacterium]|nr:hypothetical protein [Gammaproteobacteria bacterium]